MVWIPAALLLVTVAIGAVLALWIRWLAKRTPAPRWVLVVVSVVALAPVGLGMLGTVFGLVKSFGAIGGESVDPSQKARILAEGISEAMNCLAFGMLIAFLAVPLVLLALTWRYRWSRRTV